MNIRLSDGRARAARYRLRVESLPRLDSRTEPPPFYLDGGKAACFDDRELSRAEAWLKDRGIKYEIEKLSAPANWDLTEGVKYSSIEEVRAHLEQGIEPESMVIPRLRERVQAAEVRAAVAEARAARVDELEAAEMKAAARVDELEARLQILESAADEPEKGEPEKGEPEKEEPEKEEPEKEEPEKGEEEAGREVKK